MRDQTAKNGDVGSGSYLGGKAGAGVYQTLINMIPPHNGDGCSYQHK